MSGSLPSCVIKQGTNRSLNPLHGASGALAGDVVLTSTIFLTGIIIYNSPAPPPLAAPACVWMERWGSGPGWKTSSCTHVRLAWTTHTHTPLVHRRLSSTAALTTKGTNKSATSDTGWRSEDHCFIDSCYCSWALTAGSSEPSNVLTISQVYATVTGSNVFWVFCPTVQRITF